jgi:hypothetical protein
MAIALVQSPTVNVNVSTSATVTMTQATTAGNLLVGIIGGWNGGVSAYTLPAGWVQPWGSGFALPKTGSSRPLAPAYYPNNPGGISSVVVNQNANGWAGHQLLEFSGVAAAPFIGMAVNVNSGGATSIALPSPTLRAGQLAVMILVLGPTATSFVPASGWTGAMTAMSNLNVAYQYIAPAADGAVTPSCSWTSSVDVVAACLLFDTPHSAASGTQRHPVYA